MKPEQIEERETYSISCPSSFVASASATPMASFPGVARDSGRESHDNFDDDKDTTTFAQRSTLNEFNHLVDSFLQSTRSRRWLRFFFKDSRCPTASSASKKKDSPEVHAFVDATGDHRACETSELPSKYRRRRPGISEVDATDLVDVQQAKVVSAVGPNCWNPMDGNGEGLCGNRS